MTGALLLQSFLLAQMRAESLVAQALDRLGVDRRALDTANIDAEAHGLTQPGHSMMVYRQLLGSPTGEERLETNGLYREVVEHYVLPLWPYLRFSVYGDVHGRTGGVGFTVPLDAPRVEIRALAQLAAWGLVEDQLKPLLSAARIVDEWYPQKDYECALAESDGARTSRCILRFDFNLLQQVERL